MIYRTQGEHKKKLHHRCGLIKQEYYSKHLVYKMQDINISSVDRFRQVFTVMFVLHKYYHNSFYLWIGMPTSL
jgi:hypothetical protein